jgi:hypothetical protein
MKHSWNEEEQGRGIMADRFDLDAIEADDALLDLLAAGGESARRAGEHDPAVALLADLRLAVEVEDELPVETIDDPESFLARCAALNPMTDPFARKVATRGLAFGVAAVAALSVSGVAAAVTGDPLSPYEKVIEKMVDAVRPQTSFPKEDVDGAPVVDRSKIVKVGKDFKEKARAEHAAQNGKVGTSADDDPQSQEIKGTPEELLPTDDKPVASREWPFVLPTEEQKTEEPVKPTTEVPTDTKTTEPTDTKTTEPTDTKTTENPPDTPPSTPTDEPTDTTTTPAPTDPTTTTTPTDPTTTTSPTPPPTTVDTGNGDTDSGDNTVSGDPTVTPSQGSGAGQTSDEETTAPDSDSTTTPEDTSGGGAEPSSPVTQVPDVKELASTVVETVVGSVLPTPTGQPVTIESAERFFGESVAPKEAPKAKPKTTAKHSSGHVTTGSVRKAYPTGKHSTGQYAEGKHAAIERTYGSTTDASLLQILDVVNKPIR